MSKDTNSFGHDKALACESRGFVYKKKRMHRFDTPSCLVICYAITKRVTLLWVRLGLGEQPFSFVFDWRVIGGHNRT